MINLRTFFLGLFLSFGAPWLILAVIPALQAQRLAPLTYDKDKDGMSGVYPDKTVYLYGARIYAREGCAQCHTQMIRPGFDGVLDPWHKGWGSDQADIPKDPARPNTLRDYNGEPFAYLGIQRNGPDLANLGYRLEKLSDAEIHAHLYNPRATVHWSNMPSFANLYDVVPVQGNGSPNALKLTGEAAPPSGYQVLPNDDAKELLKYLRSLRRDAPLPGQPSANK